jgi:hypothetical protein
MLSSESPVPEQRTGFSYFGPRDPGHGYDATGPVPASGFERQLS